MGRRLEAGNENHVVGVGPLGRRLVDRAKQPLHHLFGTDHRQFEPMLRQPRGLPGREAWLRADVALTARQERTLNRGGLHGPEPHVDHDRLAGEPGGVLRERAGEAAARGRGVVERVDRKAGIPLEHRPHRLERALRIAVHRQDRTVVFEVEIVGQKQIDGAGPIADHGPVERVVADIGFNFRRRLSRGPPLDDAGGRTVLGLPAGVEPLEAAAAERWSPCKPRG